MPIQSFDMAEKYLNHLLFEFYQNTNSKQRYHQVFGGDFR